MRAGSSVSARYGPPHAAAKERDGRSCRAGIPSASRRRCSVSSWLGRRRRASGILAALRRGRGRQRRRRQREPVGERQHQRRQQRGRHSPLPRRAPPARQRAAPLPRPSRQREQQYGGGEHRRGGQHNIEGCRDPSGKTVELSFYYPVGVSGPLAKLWMGWRISSTAKTPARR